MVLCLSRIHGNDMFASIANIKEKQQFFFFSSPGNVMVTSHLANRITLRRETPSIPFSDRVEGKNRRCLLVQSYL